jgi:hypothetical protein
MIILLLIYNIFILGLVFSGMPLFIVSCACLVCLIAFSCIRFNPFKAILWKESEGWCVYDNGFKPHDVILCKQAYSSWGLIIIHFYCAHRKCSLIIWRDSMTKETYKKFRLYLLNGGLYEH